ncbi:MAG: GIY-YIG nuclease family protein [Ignavibacteria bacterium]|nr:GIY-YIG nuclease family protein [Ignavibacteria bacterium]
MSDRSELKREYKNKPVVAGVFRILNTRNGKSFLSSSLNLQGVLNKHKFTLTLGSHMNDGLQEDFHLHGSDAFVFEILETLPVHEDPKHDYSEDLAILELIWVDKLEPFGEKGYNVPGRKLRTA